MRSREAINALGALASDARLAAYRLLVKRGPAGYTPTELIERLRVPSPTLAFHLKELVNAGLVVSRREGRKVYYSSSIDCMKALMGFLTENCCSEADVPCDGNCQPIAVAQKRRA